MPLDLHKAFLSPASILKSDGHNSGAQVPSRPQILVPNMVVNRRRAGSVSILLISFCTPFACRDRSHQDLLAKFDLREGWILHAIALCCKGRYTTFSFDFTCTTARIAHITLRPWTTVGLRRRSLFAFSFDTKGLIHHRVNSYL
jgi:hypothetical protein